MLWLEARSAFRTMAAAGARPIALAVVLACAAPLLSGCSDGSGFRPLYATTSSTGGAGVEQKFSQIDFVTIPGRVGQRVRNELVFQGTAGSAEPTKPADAAYRLEVMIRENMLGTLVARSGESAGAIYAADASFQLVRNSDKKVVLTGTSFARAGFERYTTIYSNVRAREDAENRAARTIATDIRARLTAFLSTQS